MTTPSIQDWLELVADYETQPGRQLKAFAEEHAVDAGEFLGWLKRVRLEGAADEVAEVTEVLDRGRGVFVAGPQAQV